MTFDNKAEVNRVHRSFIGRLINNNPDAVTVSKKADREICGQYILIIVCPSSSKECGIGRYSTHAAEAALPHYKQIKILQTTYQALKFVRDCLDPCIVMFQHEYSLVDFQYDLGEDDTTTSVITNLSIIQQLDSRHRTAIFMHSVYLTDHGLNKINLQIFSANIPIFHTNREGCAKAHLNFTELGIPGFGVMEVPKLPKEFTVGAFGFLSPNKDVRSTLEVCARAGVYIRANYAPNNTGSPQSIIEAQRHVEAQVKEMNVSGKVTFDFMSDEDLRAMIAETSVVYAPQHDFSHYATSASVRFPLAVGRGAIVPPHRCFHDLAAGVRFARLDEAVAIVTSMAANPQEAYKLAEIGLDYAKRNELGKIYKELGERLIDNRVWCGGDTDGFRIPKKYTDIAERIISLDDHDPWSHQNEMGRNFTDRGLIGGFFVHDANPALGSHVEKSIQVLSEKIDHQLSEEKVYGVISEILKDISLCRKHLRYVFGGNKNYLSVIEIIGLPSYLQLLVLKLRFELNASDIAKYLICFRKNIDDNMMGVLFQTCETFAAMCNSKDIDTECLVWGGAVLASNDRIRKIIYPEYLLGLGSDNFITGLYRSVLHRNPDQPGIENLQYIIKSGMKKSDIVFSVANSPEGKEVGIKLGRGLAEWHSCEDQIVSLIEMSKLVAPYEGLIKTQNLALKDTMYAGNPS